MTALLIGFGAAFVVAGVVIFPVMTHALLEPLPPRSARRLLLGLLAVAANLGTTAGGVLLVCLTIR